MPTPVKNLDAMTKHLTQAEIEARSARESSMPARRPKKPKLIIQNKAAGKHWSRILRDIDGLEIIDVLDTDVLAIYCLKLARRDSLQARYLELDVAADSMEGDSYSSAVKTLGVLASDLAQLERDILTYASRLGLTPESRLRLAKRMAEQEEYDPDADLFA